MARKCLSETLSCNHLVKMDEEYHNKRCPYTTQDSQLRKLIQTLEYF